MYGIFTYIWLFLMVKYGFHVGRYTRQPWILWEMPWKLQLHPCVLAESNRKPWSPIYFDDFFWGNLSRLGKWSDFSVEVMTSFPLKFHLPTWKAKERPIFKAVLLLVVGVKLPKKIGH